MRLPRTQASPCNSSHASPEVQGIPDSASLRWFLGQQVLEICKGSVGRRAAAGGGAASSAACFQVPLVLVVVAVKTQQLPVAAIGRVVVVIVVPVVDRQFA